MTKLITKFSDMMTKADIGKFWKQNTGKTTGSSAFNNLFTELQKTSTPLTLGSSILYYPKEDVLKTFTFSFNAKIEEEKFKKDLKEFIELNLSLKIDKFIYKLNLNQKNLILNDEFFCRAVGYLQQFYKMNIELVGECLIFERRV